MTLLQVFGDGPDGRQFVPRHYVRAGPRPHVLPALPAALRSLGTSLPANQLLALVSSTQSAVPLYDLLILFLASPRVRDCPQGEFLATQPVL